MSDSTKSEAVRLGRAISLAAQIHEGQIYRGMGGRADRPYIEHALNVMWRVPRHLRVLAVLHDAIEDGDGRRDHEVFELLTDAEAAALRALTRDKSVEGYQLYIQRLSANALAREVKFADLDENITSRPPPRLMDRYRRALSTLADAEVNA